MTIEELARNIVTRMVEIDSDISKSLYNPNRTDQEDRPPEGDDYKLLWDAIVDELTAADVNISPLKGGPAA